jgi:hypothetical protein
MNYYNENGRRFIEACKEAGYSSAAVLARAMKERNIPELAGMKVESLGGYLSFVLRGERGPSARLTRAMKHFFQDNPKIMEIWAGMKREKRYDLPSDIGWDPQDMIIRVVRVYLNQIQDYAIKNPNQRIALLSKLETMTSEFGNSE